MKIGVFRRVYNLLSSATGLGITENIIDCYSALIQLWRPGDRIFLFGFSRGAYTVRCLGGVLGSLRNTLANARRIAPASGTRRTSARWRWRP